MDIPFRGIFYDYGLLSLEYSNVFFCIVLAFRRFPKIPFRKYLEHGSSGHEGAFPGETGLLKMVPADVPNRKLCFISSLCLIFDTSSKFWWPYVCFACHLCITNVEYLFQNFAYN